MKTRCINVGDIIPSCIFFFGLLRLEGVQSFRKSLNSNDSLCCPWLQRKSEFSHKEISVTFLFFAAGNAVFTDQREKRKKEGLVVFSSSCPPAPHLLQVLFFLKATRFLTEMQPDTRQPPLLISRIRKFWWRWLATHSVLVQDASLAALDVSSHQMPLLSALVVLSVTFPKVREGVFVFQLAIWSC